MNFSTDELAVILDSVETAIDSFKFLDQDERYVPRAGTNRYREQLDKVKNKVIELLNPSN